MHKFYFNECLIGDVSKNEFISLFSKTIVQYDSLIKKNIGIEKSIITEKILSEVCINGIKLKDIITSIGNRSIRDLSFSYLTKYPIGKYFNDDIENLLSENYMFERLDALNLAIVATNNGFLFSVATDNLLKKDMLELRGIHGKLEVHNLYGEKSNTDNIERYIIYTNNSKLSIYEQLKKEIGNCIIHHNFEKIFLSESIEVQKSIIEAFKDARKRQLPSPYFPDTNLIKDVTPNNANRKANVYELRVKYPIAIRVYFYESTARVYIAKIGYKADYKEDTSSQTKEINAVHQILHTMVLTNLK